MPQKKVLVLLDDYWHPRADIDPVLPTLLPADRFAVQVTTDPNDLTALSEAPDLFINFKDGIADTQIPTPNWYDGALEALLPRWVQQEGMGFLGVHCGLANIPPEHAAFHQVLRGRFLHHPPQCEVTFTPAQDHPITQGVRPFTITDEHYFVEVLADETQVLGRTSSVHGDNIALWAHQMGKGRVCGVTPGHSLAVLQHPEYVKLLQNAIDWVTR
ncbi:MAG: ThuA domain-containing protein [Oscillospiraceae bacterium]|jgi:type 1 glutamine amidotransferase|nr:ThuA domain-containing protein [Oscillospiraceae bacterium]